MATATERRPTPPRGGGNAEGESPERISIEELRRLVRGVRSISGLLRVARRLWQQEIAFDHGPEKAELLGRLIDQFPRDVIEGRGVDMRVARGLIQLYLVRSSQYATGEVDIEAGVEDARRALTLARTIGEKELERTALNSLGNALLAQQKVDEGAIIFRQEAEVAREQGNLPALVRALYNLARALVTSGNRIEAKESVREGLDLYEGPHGDDLPLFGKAFLLQIWQDLHDDLRKIDESIRIARQSIEILKELDMTDRLIAARLGLIRCYLITSDLVGGMEEVLQIERIATPSVSPFLQCQHMVGLTAIHSALEEWDTAEECGIRGLELARDIGSGALEAILLERLAEVARRHGNPSLGIARAEEALRVEHQPHKRAHILRLLADIHLDLDHFEEAGRVLQEGEELLEKIGQTDDRGFFQLTRGRLLLGFGRDAEAEKVLRSVQGLIIPARPILTHSHRLLANICFRGGRVAEALREFETYHQLVVQQEANRRDAQLLALRTQHELRWEHQQVKTRQEEDDRRREELQSLATDLIRIRERFPHIVADLDRLVEEQDEKERQRIVSRLRGHFRESEAREDLDVLRHLRGLDGDFTERLVAACPTITPRQIRLASVIRSGLHTPEICDLLDITPETLQMQRKRLRKRLGLKQGQSLEERILKI